MQNRMLTYMDSYVERARQVLEDNANAKEHSNGVIKHIRSEILESAERIMPLLVRLREAGHPVELEQFYIDYAAPSPGVST